VFGSDEGMANGGVRGSSRLMVMLVEMVGEVVRGVVYGGRA
jgi:hypothetical protein